jgi:phenylacetate-CoA ligase
MLDLSPRPDELEPIERASRDELESLQLERLRWTLRHAYERVPFYRARFDQTGIHPEDCRELADLAKLPFTTKEDLRASYPFAMFAVPASRSHGSTRRAARPAGRR